MNNQGTNNSICSVGGTSLCAESDRNEENKKNNDLIDKRAKRIMEKIMRKIVYLLPKGVCPTSSCESFEVECS